MINQKIAETICKEQGHQGKCKNCGTIFSPMDPDYKDVASTIHKEKCLRIKAEMELQSFKKDYERIVGQLKVDLWEAKRNWWRRFRLPKLVWRDEHED